MIYTVQINEKEYEVEVERGKATLHKTTQILVEQPAAAKTAAPAQNASAPAAVVPSQPAPGAGNPVVAPMPGVIQDVKVSVGQTVAKGQILLILEAMKMENEIFAPAAGVITQIQVSKGASVATNDVLLTIQ